MAGTGWLRDCVIYQLFMPSFADGDGDGIGDLKGAIAHLDHLEWLGIDAVWVNPCFVSPFRDAGYDVADYLTIAPRYGTNKDMTAFIAEAGRRGIRVLLDLVAGHTSARHPWFQASASDSDDDRYIWSDRPGPGFVPSPGRRRGYYLKNFFDEQPALNFGYARADDAEPWRQPPGAPGPRANRNALCQIMAYWLDRGVAGFRVDMAYSLVKDDPDFAATVALWADLRAWVQARYPDAVLLPENDYRVAPGMGARAGFDADFFLVIEQAHSLLFNNGGAGTQPTLPEHSACYFDATAPDPGATLGAFLRTWDDHQAGSGAGGLSSFPPPTTTSPGSPPPRARPRSSARRSRSCSPGDRSPRSTTATKSACATSPGCPTTRAADGAPGSTGPGAAPPCSGTPPCPTRVSRPLRLTGSTFPKIPTRTARPSRPSTPTQPRP